MIIYIWHGLIFRYFGNIIYNLTGLFFAHHNNYPILYLSKKFEHLQTMIIPSRVLTLITALSQSEGLDFCIILRNKEDDNDTCRY